MKEVTKLKSILGNYLKNYNKLYKNKEQLIRNEYYYENILKILTDCISDKYDGILQISSFLNPLFGNRYNELQENIFICERLQLINKVDSDEYKKSKSIIINLTNEIKNKYLENKEEKEEILINLSLMETNIPCINRVINSLKFSQLISNDDIGVVNKIVREFDYSDTEVAFLIENLFLYNEEIKNKKLDKISSDDKYKFINLLSIGNEVIELPFVEDDLSLQCIADSIYDILDNCPYDIIVDNYIDILPVVGKDVKNIDELKYVIIKLLEKFRNSLNERIELIKDEDFIMNLDIKNEIAEECYKFMDQYLLFRNYMDDKLELTQEENNDAIDDENKLFYLINNGGKCYLISDLKNMPLEYIAKVKELIDKFKDNTISNKKNKKLVDFGREFSELKDDQIRIIYKRIKDNNYLIYGAFIKKDDWKYRTDFKNVINRVGTISENPLELEKEIDEYINEHQRKWSR